MCSEVVKCTLEFLLPMHTRKSSLIEPYSTKQWWYRAKGEFPIKIEILLKILKYRSNVIIKNFRYC